MSIPVLLKQKGKKGKKLLTLCSTTFHLHFHLQLSLHIMSIFLSLNALYGFNMIFTGYIVIYCTNMEYSIYCTWLFTAKL